MRVEVLVRLMLTFVLLAAFGSAEAQSKDSTRRDDRGVQVPGWTGRVDAAAEKAGAKLTDVKVVSAGDSMHVTTGPPGIYWSSANRAAGSFTVSATFSQVRARGSIEYYGVFMGGSQLNRESPAYLHCSIAGNGTFMVKHRSGRELNELASRTAHVAIRRTDANGQATNTLAWRVTPQRTSCLVNGTEVWGYATPGLIGPGRLQTTDGLVGLRVEKDLELRVTGFSLAK